MSHENIYPRPDFQRSEWTDLCGEWEFEFDFGKSGLSRGLLTKEKYDKIITVPFCPESKLSGIGFTDFINACWYRRVFSVDKKANKRVIINFEAVCNISRVFINGNEVGTHTGGYTPFSFDITESVKDGENTVTVYCENDPRDKKQPSGKQSPKYESYGCVYTRSTGIYQPVWIEYLPENYVKDAKIDTDIENSLVTARLTLVGSGAKNVKLYAYYKDKNVGSAYGFTSGSIITLQFKISEIHLWEIENPEMYSLKIAVESDIGDEIQTDTVICPFGMRSIRVSGTRLLLNGKPLFMRLVLDQGYYPDGIYTEPNDEALKKDILLSKRIGFNGARLHQRTFSRRFLHYADKLGYIVWGEYANWGFNHSADFGLDYYLPEWTEAMDRDYNHPSLIGWCPFNETWDLNGTHQNDRLIKNIYEFTKKYDMTRPVIDTSGNYHVATDIYDVHDYNQKPTTLYERYGDCVKDNFYERFSDRQGYIKGLPFFVSEYGGIMWAGDENVGWGYGDKPTTKEEYVERFCGLIKSVMTNENTCGVCYTQLYDVEQERNGIYYYGRTPKFSEEQMDKMRDAMSAPAACELLDNK